MNSFFNLQEKLLKIQIIIVKQFLLNAMLNYKQPSDRILLIIA